MASMKMPLVNLLNMLVAHPSGIARQERHVSSETSRQSENERKVTRKSVYLTAEQQRSWSRLHEKRSRVRATL